MSATTAAQNNFSKTLKLKFLKYFEIAKISYTDNIAYLSEPIGFAVMMAVRVWVFFELYKTVYSARGNGSINGFSLATTLWLLSLVQVFQTSSRIKKQVKNLGDSIISGNFVYTITRPYDFMIFYMGENLGDMVGNIIISIIPVCLVAYFLVGPIHFSISSILLGLLLLIFGIGINLSITFILGITAFWTESTAAARWIYDKMVWVFGGSVVPITFFPDSLRKIVEFFPFTNIYYDPARIMVSYDAGLFIKTLLVQIFWLIVLIYFGRKLYRKGIRELAVNGG